MTDQSPWEFVRHQPLTVFTSPKSGSGRGRDEINRLMTQLQSISANVTLTSDVAVLDQMRDEAIRDVHDRGAELDQSVVIPVGGDGTISLVASRLGLIDGETADRFALLPMPMGTENLLARYLGYRFDANSVIATLQNGTIRKIDCGMVGPKPFLTMATFGFDAEVVRALHLRRKGHIRKLSYIKPIVRAMKRYSFPPISIKVQAGDLDDCYGHVESNASRNKSNESDKSSSEFVVDVAWAMCFNLPCYGGGLQIEPAAVGDDGYLDFIGFRNGSIPSGLRYALAIKRASHLRHPDVIRFRARAAAVTSTEMVPWQHDGDYGGQTRPLESAMVLSIGPGRLSFLVPA